MIRTYWHEESGKKFSYSYSEKQVRQFPEGQRRLKRSEILKPRRRHGKV